MTPAPTRAPNALLRTDLADEAEAIGTRTLSLVSAPGGFGKTTLARRWQERLQDGDRPVAWLSLSAIHADLTLFLEDLLDAIRETLSESPKDESTFGDRIERAISSGAAGLAPERLARDFARDLRACPHPPIIFLDALEHLPRDGGSQGVVDALLRLEPCPAAFVVTTRGSRPDVTTRLLAAGAAHEITGEELSLRSAQLAGILSEADIEPEPELVAILLARTGGWAMAVRLMVRALSSLPADERLAFLRGSGGETDLFEYVATELLGRIDADGVALIETAALLGAATRSTLGAASGLTNAEEKITEAIDSGLLSSTDEGLAVHDLWRDWLIERMRARREGRDWRDAHERIGSTLVREGRSERALDHYVAAIERPGVEDHVVRILSEEADRWVSRGHRTIVERALAVVSPDRRAGAPALIALEGLLLSGSDPDRAITHLRTAAAGYQDAGNTRAEFMCLHELAVVAVNENRMSEVWAIYRRALSLRRLVLDPALRGFVVMALGHGAMISGRYGMARRFHELALTYDHDARERGGIAIVQSAIRIQSGDWDDALRDIESLLARPAQRAHGITYHGVQIFRATIESARGGSTERVRRWLDEAIDAFESTHHTLSLLRAHYALGRHAQRSGDDETAKRSYEQAVALATRSEFWEALAATEGCLARLHQRRGETEAARSAAGRALTALESPDAWSIRRGRMLSWSSGIALAIVVLAETDDAERASRFLDRFGSRIAQPDLPLCQHAVLCLQARVELAAGRDAAATRSLSEAWRIAEKASLVDYAPELDAELLEAAAREAQSRGIDGRALASCLARFGVTASPNIAIRSFGGLAVERAGKRLGERAWRGTTPKRLLMRLLVADGHSVTRERLQADLWPDLPPRRAGNNLRVAISHLREAIEPKRLRRRDEPLIQTEGGRVALAEALSAGWDVTRAGGALERARTATDREDEATARAAAGEIDEHVRDELLPESYDEWVIDFRRTLDRRITEEARALASVWRERKSTGVACDFVRIALGREPADERSWEILVGTHRDADDHAGALRAYQEARRALERELDAEPGPRLRALIEDLGESFTAGRT